MACKGWEPIVLAALDRSVSVSLGNYVSCLSYLPICNLGLMRPQHSRSCEDCMRSCLASPEHQAWPEQCLPYQLLCIKPCSNHHIVLGYSQPCSVFCQLCECTQLLHASFSPQFYHLKNGENYNASFPDLWQVSKVCVGRCSVCPGKVQRRMQGSPGSMPDANAKLVLHFSLIGTVASFPFISQFVEAVALWTAPLSQGPSRVTLLLRQPKQHGCSPQRHLPFPSH